MAGSEPVGNLTSTTGPTTSRTLPVATVLSRLLLQGFGAAHHLEELLGDALLAGAVVLAAQGADDVVRRVRRLLHGVAARGELGCERFEDGRVDLDLEVLRQEQLE